MIITNQEARADDLLVQLKETLTALEISTTTLSVVAEADRRNVAAKVCVGRNIEVIQHTRALLAQINKGNTKPYWYWVCKNALKYLDHAEVHSIPFALPVSNVIRQIEAMMKPFN
jgi:hypothetical protein